MDGEITAYREKSKLKYRYHLAMGAVDGVDAVAAVQAVGVVGDAADVEAHVAGADAR